MALHKLLVATDFSARSDVAIQHALSIANTSGARVILAHVWNPSAHEVPAVVDERTKHYERFVREGAAQLHQRFARDARAARRHELTRRAAQLRDRGVSAQHLWLEGAPADVICEAARHEAADLILIGTHGHASVDRILLGSVAERVLRHSHVPVLLARPATRREYKHILVPTDFTPHAEHALFHATQLAPPAGFVDLVVDFADD